MPIDRAKLIKIMAMTESSNDGEVLNAIRMANAMLATYKLDWESAIAGAQNRPSQHQSSYRPPMKPAGRGTSEAAAKFTRPKSRFTDREIPRMLSSLIRDTKGGFRGFLVSIQSHWEEKGYLTEGQYEALTNAYERAK